MQNVKLNSNLRRLAFEKKCNISKIARKTGISRTTISSLYHQKCTGVSLTTLEKLCSFFDCGIAELLVLEPIDDTKGA